MKKRPISFLAIEYEWIDFHELYRFLCSLIASGFEINGYFVWINGWNVIFMDFCVWRVSERSQVQREAMCERVDHGRLIIISECNKRRSVLTRRGFPYTRSRCSRQQIEDRVVKDRRKQWKGAAQGELVLFKCATSALTSARVAETFFTRGTPRERWGRFSACWFQSRQDTDH